MKTFLRVLLEFLTLALVLASLLALLLLAEVK
jgi:hypothetical protein